MSERTQIELAQAMRLPEKIEALPLGKMVSLVDRDDLGDPIESVYIEAGVWEASGAEHLGLTTTLRTPNYELRPNRTAFLLRSILAQQYTGIESDIPHQSLGLGAMVFRSSLPREIGGIVASLGCGRVWNVNSMLSDHRTEIMEGLGATEALWTQHMHVVESLIRVLSLDPSQREGDKPQQKLIYINFPDNLVWDDAVQTQPAETEPAMESDYAIDRFDAFVGIDHIVGELRDLVRLANISPSRREEAGVELTQAVLLYGPSGVAKTELMRALGHELGANIEEVSFSDVSGIYVGQWASKVEQIFSNAYSNPNRVLIVLDEMDGLINSGNPNVTANITAVLKRQLEEVKKHPHVFVAAATNDIEAIDPVIRADKRIPLKLPIGLPNAEERKAILQKLLFAKKLDVTDADSVATLLDLFVSADTLDLDRLASLTENFSGGDIFELLKRIGRQKLLNTPEGQSMGPITEPELLEAIQRSKITKP